jgi:hypothetical protein
LDLQLSPGTISSKLCCVGAGAGSTAWTAAATEAAGAEGAARAFSNFASGDSRGFPKSWDHWIGLRENLQETMVFTIKYRVFWIFSGNSTGYGSIPIDTFLVG